MSNPIVRQPILAILFTIGDKGGDGGAIGFTAGGGVIHIDPLGPVVKEYLEVAQLYSQVSKVKDFGPAKQFQSTLEQYLVAKLPEVAHQIEAEGK
jgi:hypothetical protein